MVDSLVGAAVEVTGGREGDAADAAGLGSNNRNEMYFRQGMNKIAPGCTLPSMMIGASSPSAPRSASPITRFSSFPPAASSADSERLTADSAIAWPNKSEKQ